MDSNGKNNAKEPSAEANNKEPIGVELMKRIGTGE